MKIPMTSKTLVCSVGLLGLVASSSSSSSQEVENHEHRRRLELSPITSSNNVQALRQQQTSKSSSNKKKQRRRKLNRNQSIRHDSVLRKSQRILHLNNGASSDSPGSSFMKVESTGPQKHQTTSNHHHHHESSTNTLSTSHVATSHHKTTVSSTISKEEKQHPSTMTVMSGTKKVSHANEEQPTAAELGAQDTAHGGKLRPLNIHETTGQRFPETNEEPYCGDGWLDDGEECDYGIDNGYGFCTVDCKYLQISVCGNGIVEDYEECDDGMYNGYGDCTLDCYLCGHNYYADENIDGEYAAEYRNGSRTCDEENGEMLALMWLQTDLWGSTESAVFMFDTESSVDESLWSYDVGSFRPDAVYQWATCLDLNGCYEFYYFDMWGDGFVDGGIYFEADHETFLDVYSGDSGTYWMYEEFWGVRFGNGCSDEQPAGPIYIPNERVQPYDYGDDVVPPSDPDFAFADPAPFEMANTSLCGVENSVDVVLEYEAGPFSYYDNELFLFDADTPPFEFYWEYEVGSFSQGNYTWTTCIDGTKCNEFYFFDEFGDGISSGGLTLMVDGEVALSVQPGDEGTVFEGEQYWGVAFGDCQNS